MKKFLLIVTLVLIGSMSFAQERIAVFPFENLNNVLTQEESIFFYRQFSNEFANRSAGRFIPVPRVDVEKLFQIEEGFQLDRLSSRAKTAEVERVLNGTQILTGIIGRRGNSISITISLYTFPDFGQLPGGVDRRVGTTDELFNIIPELVRSMQNEIANSEQPLPEGLLYEIINGRAVTVTDYIGNAVTLDIPVQIQGLPVTAIQGKEFNGSSLTNITIPSSVTSIESGSFVRCSSLTSITVDSRNPAYSSIDGVLFDKNTRTIIKCPRGRQGTYAIPSSITTIEDAAFAGCGSLTSIAIPSSVTSIGNYAFYICSSLTSITIPSSVTSIGNETFFYCKSLASISIPSSITSIGFAAFFYCESLVSVSIPSSVTSIDFAAFQNCNSLTSVTISRRTQVVNLVFPPSAKITYRD
jgi:hypothetical protein